MTGDYYAFISYSHRDAAFASWLHGRLETYRFPRRLDRSETPHGPLPRRLTPIFRDREELSAATSLSEQVQQALSASRALVVICSPDAAASTWVNREIEEFRRIHPDRPILAALISGEPEQAFPPALLAGVGGAEPIEPLAADFRPTGDGRRWGLFKLLAALAGVPLGELVQRDAQRRLRRVMAVTAAAMLAMTLFAALTIAAIQARNEAERQRASAEGLIEFMLTDLRDRLKGVGRLDIMEAVNGRAMIYYAAERDLASRPADTLERRSRLLSAMGEDDLQTRGQEKRGRAEIAEAYRITADLLRREPDNSDRIYNHAQNEFWMGYAAYLQRGAGPTRDVGLIRRHWQRYRELARELVAIDPKRVKWLRELGFAEGNLCTLALAAPRDVPAALLHCAAARAGMERATALQPGDLDAMIDLANRQAWQAEAEAAAGHGEAALDLRGAQQALIDRAATAFPRDARVDEARLLAMIGLAKTHADLGHRDSAIATRADASRLAAALHAQDPQNQNWADWQRQIDEIVIPR